MECKRYKTIVPAILILSLVVISQSTNSTDHEALLAFKAHITSDPSLVLSSWNTSLNYCQWQGVTCSRRHPQRVVALDLPSHGLVGTVSPLIGNLSFLHTINLADNSLTGLIPQGIGHLYRLRHLILRDNAIEGEIPLNLTLCTNLRTIRIGNNRLSGKIPAILGSFPKLSLLSLDRNELTGNIPPAFGNLSSLISLSLGGNKLEGQLPQELGQLRTLSFLSLSENNLSGIVPPSLYNLSSLKNLSMAANQLQGRLPPSLGDSLPDLLFFYIAANSFKGSIPASLSNASRLERLDISENQFNGAIHMSLGRLTNLKYLSFARNMLGIGDAEDMSFVSSLTNCTSLQVLSLSYNQFTGALPNSIANLSTDLRLLSFSYNQLTGSVPSDISNLFNLYGIDMSNNRLTGTIPPSIGELSNLQLVNFAKNRISGEIPWSIGNLTNLFSFSVATNDLQGNIPPTIGNCRRLSLLYLANCNLSGTLTQQLFEIAYIRILAINMNSFTGLLPMQVGNLLILERFDTSHNRLSGKIPESLGECVSLEYLYINDNLFKGTVESLMYLKSLQEIDISQNDLSGRIPEFLQSFLYLQYLNLSFNNFEGGVPLGGIFNNITAISVIGNPRLCGGSPVLLLPQCTSNTEGEKSRHTPDPLTRILIVVITTGVLLWLLQSYVIVHYFGRRKSKENPTTIPHPLVNRLLRISYMDLSKATHGFSSTNLISAGNYASVYKGILGPNNKKVAIKVFHLQHQGAFKSFLAECDALSNIRHRNLLKVLSTCSSIDFKGNDFKALIFEYMENGNLEQWLHPNVSQQGNWNLSLIRRLNIAIDVASTLNYLHNFCEDPIIHRDLKPSNILLDDEMNARIIDFGLAKFLFENTTSESESDTTSSGIRGTIGYIAPEYGLGVQASMCGDIYSYGIILLEMFIGKKPTDEIFHGGLNLHQFARSALPNHVMKIVDPRLILLEIEGFNESKVPLQVNDVLRKCLTSIVTIGVLCSSIKVKNRMDLGDVITKLSATKELYLQVRAP